jgi:hypothetical protein
VSLKVWETFFIFAVKAGDNVHLPDNAGLIPGKTKYS